MRTLAIAAACLALAASSIAHAASVFANTITDAGQPSSSNPYSAGQTIDANLTSTGIGAGSGVTPNAGANRYNFSGWSLAAPDLNDYFSWSIVVASGYTLNLDDLAITLQSSASGPNSYILRSSLDGYASEVTSGGQTRGTTTSSALNLGASTFDNVTGTISFRLYANGSTATGGTFSVNDFVFNGTVSPITTAAVPLPTAASAGLMGLGSLALRRRR